MTTTTRNRAVKRTSRTHSAAILAAVAGSYAPAQTPWNVVHTFEGSTDDAQLGKSVQIVDELALIGVPGKTLFSTVGAVLVIDHRTGETLRVLVPSTSMGAESFGWSVDVSESIAIVGYPSDRVQFEAQGSAWMFNINTGEEIRRLLSPQPSTYLEFGSTVAIGGGFAAVHEQTWFPNCVHTFGVNSGEFLATINPPDDYTADFGAALQIEGDLLVIGAPAWKASDQSGRVFIYDHPTQTLLHDLKLQQYYDDRWFGASLALDGNLLAVGAPYDNGTFRRQGRVYLYDVHTGKQLRAFDPVDPQAHAHFGTSLDLADDQLIVGTDWDTSTDLETFAAYLFDASSGEQRLKILPPGGRDEGMDYQTAVAIDGGTAVLASPRGFLSLLDQWGIAYFFNEFDDVSLEVTPFPSVSAQPMRFEVRRGQPETSTWLLYGLDGRADGATVIPGLNVTVDLIDPKIATGPRYTDARGGLVIEFTAPYTRERIPLWFQAVQRDWVSTWYETRIVPE